MFHNSNPNYRLLVLLLGDISLNPGPFHNLQPLDHDEWNNFRHRELHFLLLNSLLVKTDELRDIARLTNVAVIRISEWKSDNSMLTSEFELISMIPFVFTGTGMEEE